jgi:hypothetical protein
LEYKIFGPGGTPGENIREQLKTLLQMDEAQRNTIIELFLRGEDDPWGRNIPRAVAASSMLPEQFSEAAGLIRSFLYAWREFNLQLSDIEGDLLLLGCTDAEIKIAIDLFDRLSVVRDQVWARNISSVQELDGLPTIDNINIICDARAVFGGFPDGAETATDSYKTFLGLKPLVIMEIISSDNYGRERRMAVQMNEESFEWFRKTIAKAQEQFAILKERIGSSFPQA